ncbi:PAS domain S-box protein [Bacillus sp. 31A1R]|uniref:histidine kinase n=1 Tax=Robertmurraya mangrovi TaxID=3098077 RepID=A0ABU5IWV8_9BACI|nr:PAS domain S-box protein [Bacillus sp. 31A1R]MDZ5471610.1 PAS domain S-box protein [Bacillus sp. 31A1R]
MQRITKGKGIHFPKNSNEATIVVDQSGKISYMNQHACQIFGLTEKNIKDYQINHLLPDIVLDKVEEGAITQLFAKHSSGKQFPLLFRTNYFSLGEHPYFFISFFDLKENNPFSELVDLKFALDESTIVAFTDKHGVIQYVNDKFCEVSKYGREELLGKDHRIINSGYHSKEFMSHLWKTISSGKVWSGEIKNKAKDGTYYWVDTTIVPFLDEHGKPYKFLAIRKEITDYKRVVEELKKSMQELVDLKFALDTSSIVAITDQKGMIKFVNEQFSNISKYSKEELLGKDHRIINSGHHSKEFFKDLWKTISSGKVWKGEIKNKAKDGSYYWVDTTIVPFLDEEGKPYQYLAIRYEITERKKVEVQLQQMMTKIIDVQEEERKRLSRNLHDGIGQNLYSHLISINILQSQVEHPLIDQLQVEATELIEEVRKISQELRPSVLDDLGLVPAIRSYLIRYSDHYKIDVQFDCYLNVRLTANKEITIYRIIQEALTNIRKYAETEKVSVTLREAEDTLRVVIEDMGKGFDVSNTNRGVGLFSMDERAKSVGGDLLIQSEIGKGTKILLEVPL